MAVLALALVGGLDQERAAALVVGRHVRSLVGRGLVVLVAVVGLVLAVVVLVVVLVALVAVLVLALARGLGTGLAACRVVPFGRLLLAVQVLERDVQTGAVQV